MDLKLRLKNESASLRWGIIGCGRIAGDFARALKYCNRKHEIVAVASATSLENAQNFASKHQLPSSTKAYGNYEELLKDPRVDVIYIANLKNSHHKWTLKGIEAHKAVLCEKPMGLDLTELREMVEISRNRKIFLMEGIWTRCFPAYRKLREIITSKQFGEVTYFYADFGLPLGTRIPLLNIGDYALQLAQFVLSPKLVKTVNVNGQRDDNGNNIWLNITLDYGNGLKAVCVMDSRYVLPNSATVVFQRGHIRIPELFWCPTRLVETPFTKAPTSFLMPGRQESVHEFPLDDEKDREKFIHPNASGLRYEADHVHDCLSQGKIESDWMSLNDSLADRELLNRVREKIQKLDCTNSI